MCVSVGVDGEEEGCKKEGEGGSMCVVEGDEDSEEEDFTVKIIENQPRKFNTQIYAMMLIDAHTCTSTPPEVTERYN